jgi:hypothetical protein
MDRYAISDRTELLPVKYGKQACATPDLIIAIVVTVVSITLWIFVATGSNVIKHIDCISSFVSAMAVAGWIRYVLARRRFKS